MAIEEISDAQKRKEAEALQSSNEPQKVSVEDNELKLELNDTPIAPDGGWGWIVVLSSFIISVIVDGIGYSFGIVKGELDAHFETPSSTSAWAGSLLNGVYLSVGPIASALSNKFGCRIVCIVGCAIASFAMFISGFSKNIHTLLLTYGVLGGIGFGFMYLPAIVMVGYYFDKRRALATGIAVCGSGIGTVIMAPLASVLLEQYSWSGTNIILAGVILHGIIFGAFYRPLPTTREVETSDLEKSHVIETILKEKRTRCYSTDTPDEPANGHTAAAAENNVTLNGGSHNEEAARLVSDGDGEKSERVRNPSARQARSRNVSTRSVGIVEDKKPMDRLDALYTGSIKALPEYKQCHGDMGAYVQSMRSLHSAPDKPNPIVAIITEMFDFSLLSSPTVILICLSGFISFAALYTPFVYAPAKAKDMGESLSRCSLIVTVLGATNTACRVLAGFISDLPFVDCVLVNTVALIGAGVLTCLVCVCNSWILLMIYAALFGVCMAAFVTLRSIVIAELLGVSKLNNAYGLLSLSQGLAVVIGSPLAGALYDWTETFNVPFIVSGVLFIISGLLSLPMRRVSSWEKSLHIKIAKDSTMNTIVDESIHPTA